jgi:alkanesulfonate monooxygenase SsuD/methylene tetrahydromethanopterin reductase-like flavin-dependent oxidoreductase (luciferase family)
MKFGILASHQYPADEDLRGRLDELWAVVELAAGVGYDSVFSINHFLGNLRTPQVVSMTAKLLQHSGDMQVGTGILLLPFFHPVHIAEEFATLDQLSGGRIILGVGAGYRDNEFRAFGIDKSERAGRLQESIELIKALWSGEEVSFRGRYFHLEGERIGIPPLQTGGPPIWVGAGGPKAIARAARIGDAWFAPGNSPDPSWLPRAVALHDEALAGAGDDGSRRERPIIVELFCGPTTQQARELCRPYIQREYFTYSAYPQLAWQKSKFDLLWEEVFLIGSPDDLEKRIRELEDIGMNHVIFRPHWTGMPAQMSQASVRLFAEEVIPRFR